MKRRILIALAFFCGAALWFLATPDRKARSSVSIRQLEPLASSQPFAGNKLTDSISRAPQQPPLSTVPAQGTSLTNGLRSSASDRPKLTWSPNFLNTLLNRTNGDTIQFALPDAVMASGTIRQLIISNHEVIRVS